MKVNDVQDSQGLRILHLCLACFYIDGFSYQENLLPKYHKKAGHEVMIAASLVSFDNSGQPSLLPDADSYTNVDGIPVVRLSYWPNRFAYRLRIYKRLRAVIDNFKPDIIFAHGPQFLDGWRVARYVRKHPQVKLYVDNHAEWANSGRTWLSQTVLHKGLWRFTAQRLSQVSERMFGVLPARVAFLTDVYKIPHEKVAFLPMGADDELLATVTPSSIRSFRSQWGIDPDDFLIVTGGKIDAHKLATLALMRAVTKLHGRSVRLIVFGSVVPEMREHFDSLCNDEQITFVGWLSSRDSTICFGSANLVVFPGRHSVYWEQVCAVGTPLMITSDNALAHIDLGGNCAYLASEAEMDIEAAIQQLLDQPRAYQAMLVAAQSADRRKFSYRAIADASIEAGIK